MGVFQVESCVGGTPVEEWTPPTGGLYVQHIKPLLPMTFKAVLWDQGERDAKTTNTTYYSTEFPAMITGWRTNLESPLLPFVYVELCHELGAEEPKEADFWQYGQRAALKLPFVGFATTTDIDKSALHPPDKQVCLSSPTHPPSSHLCHPLLAAVGVCVCLRSPELGCLAVFY